MKTGPVIIVEDDQDDIDILKEVLKELNVPNELVCFQNTHDAFQYLKNFDGQPFIIISDVNLPGENGIEFKQRIDEDEQLKKKSIPFVFHSTSAEPKFVENAYLKMTVQGYFVKGNSYRDIKNTFKMIFEYWQVCKHPNSK